MTLRLNVKVGDQILIGDNIVVTLEKKSGNSARLAFQADRAVSIRMLSEGDKQLAKDVSAG